MLPPHVAAEMLRRRSRRDDAAATVQLPLHIEDVSAPDWMTPDWMTTDHSTGDDAPEPGRVFRDPDWATNY